MSFILVWLAVLLGFAISIFGLFLLSVIAQVFGIGVVAILVISLFLAYMLWDDLYY